MVLCFVPDCDHDSARNKCRMIAIPRKDDLKRLWCNKIKRRFRSPGVSARVCGCHFEDGLNYPSKFHHRGNQAKRMLFESPEPKKRRNRKSKDSLCNENLTSTVKGTSPWKVCGLESRESIESVAEAMEVNQCGSDVSIADPDTEEIYGHRADARIVETTAGTFCPTASDPPRNAEIEVSSSSGSDKKSIHTQCDLLNCPDSDLAILKAKNYCLNVEIEKLQEKMENMIKKYFSFQDIKNKPAKVSHYTGLPNADCFYLLLAMVKEPIEQGHEFKYFKGWKVVRLTDEDQLLILLMKLRRNYSFEDLGDRFNVSDTTISNIVISWLHAVHIVLFQRYMLEMPSRRKNMTSLPACFAEYPNCRVILDCTEVPSAMPKSLYNHCKMYSSYKHRITLKGLVGIAPNGSVTLASKLYPGSTSDKKIVNHSGILKQLKPGDMVMADKGFLIANDLPVGVTLNIPPFLVNPQFTEEEVCQTNKIARARIHVERAIQRIKRYQILSFIDRHMFSYASVVFQVCAALTNLMPSLINDVSEEKD